MNKYNNYAELSEAFKNGELDPKKYFLMLDKGGVENSLSYRYDEADTACEQKQEEAGQAFSDDSVEGMLDALHIPWQWC